MFENSCSCQVTKLQTDSFLPFKSHIPEGFSSPLGQDIISLFTEEGLDRVVHWEMLAE